MPENSFDFIGGRLGAWRVLKMQAVVGEPLPEVTHLHIAKSSPFPDEGAWRLKGLISNVRYAEKREVEQLRAIQAGLGRAEATMAALIPIRKNETWWALAQDERRAIFEETSRHTEIGLKYLPAIARQLYHSRDLGERFDFLTWFEYAPEHATMFEELVGILRETPEWQYVDREFDIRLIRA